ncbi:MAG TPA: hypothetical protein VHG91_12910, partial [Longimicrobium sp.]|nr:hypothetical protein [Longimicrobium sp.]
AHLRADGRAREALEALGPPTAPPRALYEHEVYACRYARYLRAELHREVGEDDRALAWYAALAADPGADVYLASALYQQADLHWKHERYEEAGELYRRFLQLWSEPDARFVSRRNTAAARIGERVGGPTLAVP